MVSMVEEAHGLEKKAQDKTEPSDLRPQAQFYELVRTNDPKTDKEGHYLYWWNKDRKEVTREEVDMGGMRVEDAPVVQRQARSPKEARRKITKDINAPRGKGLEVKRNLSIDRKLFNEGRMTQGVLIPYYEALLEDRRSNIDEAWQYYNEAKKKADTEKEREKKGEVTRKSVSGPSASSRFQKQEGNLMTAYKDWHSGVAIFNEYLNERIGVDEPAKGASEVYRLYVKLDNKLPSYESKYKEAGSLEKVDEVLKKYEETLFKKLEAHQMLAEERGLYPVKEIPEEYPVVKSDSEKEEQQSRAEVEITEEEEKKPEKIKTQLEPKTKAKEVPAKVEESKALKEEVEKVKKVPVSDTKPKTEKAEEKPFLDQAADEIKDKGKFQKELEGSDLNKIFEGVIAGLLSENKEVEAEVSVEPILIENQEGVVSVSVQLTEPIKAVIEINLVMANSQEPGKIRKKNLDIKEKAGIFQKVALKVFKLKGKAEGALSDLNDSLLNGLNSQLEPKGVRLTDISLSFKDNTLEVSASGEEI